MTSWRHRAWRVIDTVVSSRPVQITVYVLLVLWTALLMSAYIGYLVLVISGEETADFYDLFVLGTSLTAGT